ncbi:hypothetical protein CANCADRAFT_143037 [Tortispora caseinolytica NRRL Y-17796]|uniref:PEBP-like protein n=1 Tax=Tortispora caseinolytica NRRL Y-17796 TaxID=767744 RepID=A0A1E4TDA1_9ASCO|nr:hypothetical protein CANCADRAFT_143037 [Tortispora caseinolytica NRRL Y-17796]
MSTFRRIYNSVPGIADAYGAAQAVLKKIESRNAARIQRLQQKIDALDPNDAQYEARKRQMQYHIMQSKFRDEINKPEFQELILNPHKPAPMSEYTAREIKKQHWHEKQQMLLMQRLEQLHIIPDTLPTFRPKVDVSLRFPGLRTRVLEPGTILPSSVTARPPVVNIQPFDEHDEGLYSIILVNPDIADTENDSFRTKVHWVLADVPISLTNTRVKYPIMGAPTEDEGTEVLQYIPPTPELNAGFERLCLWAFWQRKPIVGIEDLKTQFQNVTSARQLRDMCKRLQLRPLGAHVWRNRYDRTTDSVREQYGLPEGRVFTPIRISERPATKRNQFN